MSEYWQGFYTSMYDRYRIIELVLEKERCNFVDESDNRVKLREKELAARCPPLTQYNIALMENLTKSIGNRRRVVHRHQLLGVAARALRLPQWKVDTLLILFIGEPMTKEEVWSSLQYIPKATVQNYTPSEFREATLNWLEEVRKWRWPDGEAVPARVNVWGAEPKQRLQANDVLRNMEAEPGMRLMVTALPTHLTENPPLDADDWLSNHSSTGDDYRSILGTVISQQQLNESFSADLGRHLQYRQQLELYGEAAIYSQVEMQHLMQGGDVLTRERLRRQFRALMNLLQHKDNFYVGLAERVPGLELEIKGFDHAMMRSTGRDTPSTWGSRYIEWKDTGVVLSFVIDFWRHFYGDKTINSVKASVIGKLAKMIEPTGP